MAEIRTKKTNRRAGNPTLVGVACAFFVLSSCGEPAHTETQSAILTPEKHPEIAVSRNFRISGDSVGDLQIGSAMASVKEILSRERLRKQTYTQEGTEFTALEVYHDSLPQPSLVLLMNCNPEPCVVRHIAIKDSRYHTSKGMGIGDTFGELKASHKLAYVGWGEGKFVAVAEDLPVTFELDITQIGEGNAADLTAATLPDSTKISGLFMFNPKPRTTAADSLQQRAEQ